MPAFLKYVVAFLGASSAPDWETWKNVKYSALFLRRHSLCLPPVLRTPGASLADGAVSVTSGPSPVLMVTPAGTERQH